MPNFIVILVSHNEMFSCQVILVFIQFLETFLVSCILRSNKHAVKFIMKSPTSLRSVIIFHLVPANQKPEHRYHNYLLGEENEKNKHLSAAEFEHSMTHWFISQQNVMREHIKHKIVLLIHLIKKFTCLPILIDSIALIWHSTFS